MVKRIDWSVPEREQGVDWGQRALRSLIIRGLPVKEVAIDREYMHTTLYIVGDRPARTLIVPLVRTATHPAHNFEYTLQAVVALYWKTFPTAIEFPPDPRPRVSAESSL